MQQSKPTVTAADIARLAGVGRAAVSNWRKRHTDFPAPVGGTAASPEFDLTEVEQWLRRQGKLPELSPEDRLWHLVSAGDNPAATLGAVGGFLLARQRGEKPSTRGVPAGLLREAAALADGRGEQAVFDELWRRYSEPSAGRPRATPDDLAELMVGLADVAGGSVLDPACGTGGTLRAAVRAGCASAWGQELDEDQARLAALWLALRGVTGGVRTGDSLRADAFTGETFDAVICHPPFGVTNWGHEELGYDPRWTYGLPPRTEPELAWVQHALAHLRPGGCAVILMPPAAASRRPGRRIRAELLRRGALRAVVALPARAAAPHGVPLHLWVLRRPDTDAPPPVNMLLVDAATIADDELPEIYPRVLQTVRDFAADPDQPVEEPGFARAVPIIELLDEEVDLTPARRHPAADAERTGEQVIRTRDRLTALVTEIPRLMPDVVAGPDGVTAPLTVSVAELAKTGALQLLGPVRLTTSEAGESGDDRPVLTVHDVVQGEPPSGRVKGRLTPQITVQRGDVVVPMAARQLTARVIEEDGALLGRNLYLLRPNPAVLDPWFLAGHLRTSANERQASSLSGTLRFDIRRAQVPRVPLDEQRRYGGAFRRLDEFDNALRQAAKLGAELVRITADGLAHGVFSPASPAD